MNSSANTKVINGFLWLEIIVFVFLALVSSSIVRADEFRPVLLDIKERDIGWFDVTWKVPTKGDKSTTLNAKLPEQLQLLGTIDVQNVPGATIERATYKNTGSTLTGGQIVIEGLASMPGNVILHIEMKDGTLHSAVLNSTAPEFIIPEQASKWEVATSYTQLGIIHILEGVDHLLFVLALLLLVSGLGPLLKAITAFTVAHSITLALATLGLLHLPPAPTEAIIALSILFLATEIIHQHNGQIGVTERYPWIVAFLFGLFHGLGFAGALSEVGVPQHEVSLALFTFNVGVEIGQLIFIAAVLGVFAVLKRIPITAPKESWRVLPYSIGSIAAFWTIERVVSFLPVAI